MSVDVAFLVGVCTVVGVIAGVAITVERKADKKDVDSKLKEKKDVTDCDSDMESLCSRMDALSEQMFPLSRELGEARAEMKALTLLLKNGGGR